MVKTCHLRNSEILLPFSQWHQILWSIHDCLVTPAVLLYLQCFSWLKELWSLLLPSKLGSKVWCSDITGSWCWKWLPCWFPGEVFMLRQCVASLLVPIYHFSSWQVVFCITPLQGGKECRSGIWSHMVGGGVCLNFVTGTSWWITWAVSVLWCALWPLLTGAFSAFCWLGVDVGFSSQETDDSWWTGWHQACSTLMLSVAPQHCARTHCTQCLFICTKLLGDFFLKTQLTLCLQ